VNIALDVNSGAIHVLDDLAYKIVESISKNVENAQNNENLEDLAKLSEKSQKSKKSKKSQKWDLSDLAKISDIKTDEQTLQKIQQEIAILQQKGQLFSPEPDKKLAIANVRAKNQQQVVKALCLHIAHDCNLRCEYCFAGDGDYGAISKSVMSAEVAKKAIDFLLVNSGNRRNLEIDFFGGEPTLNFETVKTAVEYAKSKENQHNKKFRFTLTTNGILLDSDKISYINANMDNVVLSLDGRQEVNDKMRKTANAKGSYEMVVPKFLELVAARGDKNYYVRGTYTAENLDFTNDVNHIHSLGFTQISVEPVIGPFSAEYSLKEDDLPILLEQYEKLAVQMAENFNSEKLGNLKNDKNNAKQKGFNFFHFGLNLNKPPCAAKRITGCGAGSEYLAVTPEGDLYPCHQFVGDADFLLGNVNVGFFETGELVEKGEIVELVEKGENKEKSRKIDQFSECNIYNKQECDACWAKYFCGGGCMANAFHLNGNIMQPDKIGCELQRKRTECAIYLAAAGVS